MRLTYLNIVSLFLDSAGNDSIFFPSPYLIIQRIWPFNKNFMLFVNRNTPTNSDFQIKFHTFYTAALTNLSGADQLDRKFSVNGRTVCQAVILHGLKKRAARFQYPLVNSSLSTSIRMKTSTFIV